jgi:short/branched chain acyl-CoA dehydrogenase
VDFELTEDQRTLKATIREFAEAEVAPRAAEWDRQGIFPLETIRKLGDLGVMGIPFPEEYGGLGQGSFELAIVMEELARVDSSVAITVGANVSLGGAPIALFGTEEQKRRWLTPLARGEVLGAFGATEPGCGSDLQGTRTTAREEDGHWVINGTKAFITNAGTEMSAFVTITAITGTRPDGRREISNILVPNGTPGYSSARPYHKLGWHASDTRELSFEECRVPRDHLVGQRGAGARQFLAVLDGGRIGVAAMSVGLAVGALEMALAYAKERTAFGRPIASNQAVAFKLADLDMEIEAARLLTYKAAKLRDAGRPFAREAAHAKLFASELAVRAADAAMQVFGGFGYIEESPIPRFYRDAKILTIGEGTSEIQRLVIARHLGCQVS